MFVAVQSENQPIHTYCPINTPLEAQIVSQYLSQLMAGESDENFTFIRLAAEARRIHKNRYNHLCEKIKHAKEEMEAQKEAIGFTSSYCCMSKVIRKKHIVKNVKTYTEEFSLHWEPRVFQSDIDKLLEVKQRYERHPQYL